MMGSHSGIGASTFCKWYRNGFRQTYCPSRPHILPNITPLPEWNCGSLPSLSFPTIVYISSLAVFLARPTHEIDSHSHQHVYPRPVRCCCCIGAELCLPRPERPQAFPDDTPSRQAARTARGNSAHTCPFSWTPPESEVEKLPRRASALALTAERAAISLFQASLQNPIAQRRCLFDKTESKLLLIMVLSVPGSHTFSSQSGIVVLQCSLGGERKQLLT